PGRVPQSRLRPPAALPMIEPGRPKRLEREPMRITNSMLIQSALQGMRDRLADLSRAQQRATTLRRINTMSDDPVAAAEVSRIDSSLRDVEQYRKNGMAARTRLAAEDVVLTSMRTLLQQAREIALSVASLPDVD